MFPLFLTSILFFIFATPLNAVAFVLLQDELDPRPELGERLLVDGDSGFHVKARTAIGLDTVDSKSNGQSVRRLFSAVGMETRLRARPLEKFVFDVALEGNQATAESDFPDDSGWSRAEKNAELSGNLLGRLLLNDGVSVGAGLGLLYVPATRDVFSFADLSAEVVQGTAQVMAPEIVVCKQTSSWSAAFLWRGSESGDRDVKRVSGDETVEFTESVGLDEQVSAGLKLKAQSSAEWGLNLKLSTSRSTLEPDSNATSESDDVRRYAVEGTYSRGDSASDRMSFGVGYQSIAYTTQANVSHQGIPLWTFFLRDNVKFSAVTANFDALIGYGEDQQSLPGFNANYRRVLLTLAAGVSF